MEKLAVVYDHGQRIVFFGKMKADVDAEAMMEVVHEFPSDNPNMVSDDDVVLPTFEQDVAVERFLYDDEGVATPITNKNGRHEKTEEGNTCAVIIFDRRANIKEPMEPMNKVVMTRKVRYVSLNHEILSHISDCRRELAWTQGFPFSQFQCMSSADVTAMIEDNTNEGSVARKEMFKLDRMITARIHEILAKPATEIIPRGSTLSLLCLVDDMDDSYGITYYDYIEEVAEKMAWHNGMQGFE